MRGGDGAVGHLRWPLAMDLVRSGARSRDDASMDGDSRDSPGIACQAHVRAGSTDSTCLISIQNRMNRQLVNRFTASDRCGSPKNRIDAVLS